MTDTRKKRGAYSPAKKIEAVRLLHENGYNYYKTSAQTKISTASLRSWERLYAADINASNKIRDISENVELNLARIKTAFLNKHYSQMDKLAAAAVSKALQLIEIEKDLSKVNNTIKIISDFMTGINGQENHEAKRSDTYNLIQQTVVACNTIEEMAGESNKLKQ